MADVIGISSGIATLFSFADTYFPGPDNAAATIRITAGLEGWRGPDGDKEPLDDPQGGISNVKIFNNNHEMIGSSGGGDVGSGVHLDIKVSQVNEQQGYYAQIFGTDNAVCIPQVAVTWVSGEKYGWVGDFGEPCSLDWYYGGRAADGTDHEPLCVWLGFNQDSSRVPDTIEINFPRFYAASQDAVNQDLGSYCNNGLRAWKDGNDIARAGRKRSRGQLSPVRRSNPDERLVVSSFAGQKATRLCGSETSHGPDFVSLAEGLFCDMGTREVLPLCEGEGDDDCFHLEERARRIKRDVAPGKKYAKVLEWGP